jgi:hypothetical protein
MLMPWAWKKRLRTLIAEELPERIALDKMRHEAALIEHDGNLADYSRRATQWVKSKKEEADIMAILLAAPSMEMSLEYAGLVLQATEFPFESSCRLGMTSPDHLFIDVDLPEIECVCSGSQKPQSSANDRYATLAFGHCLNIVSRIFVCLPSLSKVTVAGYTQRKARTARDPDSYILEISADRPAATLALMRSASSLEDLHASMSLLDCRYEILTDGSMKTLPRPEWCSFE